MSGFGGESIGQTIQNIAGIQQMQDQARMSDILQGMSDMGGSSADMLEKAGSTALRAGMLGQAEKALGNAAQIRQRDAHAKLYQGQALEAEVEADIAKIDQFASVVGLYPDTPAGWEAAKASYLANNPNPTPMEMQVMGTPYRPGLGLALADATEDSSGEGDPTLPNVQLERPAVVVLAPTTSCPSPS